MFSLNPCHAHIDYHRTNHLSFRRFVIQSQSLPRYNYPQIINPAHQQVTVNQKGRTERISVNLEAIYPSPDISGSELCLEELRALSRGWLSKVWESEITTGQNLSENVACDDESDMLAPITHRVEKLVINRDPVTVPLDENGAIKDGTREGKGRKMKIKEVNETQISM